MNKKGEKMYDITAAYLNEIGKKKKFTPAEEKAIFARLRDGEDVRNEIIEANLKLVVSIAKKFYRTNMTLLDCIQEGTFGLMNAIDNFDYSKNLKFSTYATRWIVGYIQNADRKKYQEVYIPGLPYYSKDDKFSFLSFDADVKGYKSLKNNIIDSKQTKTFNRVESKVDFDSFWAAVSDLKPKTKLCLELYFMSELTYDDIGKKMSLSRERIRQIIDHGLRSLQTRRKNPIFREMRELQ
jgi:RNA polymerase sigma factor (sigma-70 family)